MSFRKIAVAAALVAGLQMSGSSAQSLSTQCQAALATIVGNSDASCLNAQALIGLVVSTSSTTNTSIVPTVNSWLTGMCSRPACTNATLATVVSTVTSGCSTELGELGLSDVDSSSLTALVQSAYPTVRQVACLGDTSSNNTLCVTETLNNLEPYTGTLTVSNIEAVASQIVAGTVPNVPSNVTCTDCTKAAFNLVEQNFNGLLSGFSSDVSTTCGSSFIDGTQPASVTQLASNSTASAAATSNAAAGMFTAQFGFAPLAGVAVSALVTLTSAFFVLA
ncbi:hypothetical protein TRAPUB_14265 [Trametes pubescens]|uniref:Uncharacterized protein n=1 Tax=Trametes pubescens TaxID=154538 RepID=A0A1M2VNX2_TRAPU|nr:hypothetical protein TRAPUB_14265 [Trametes pubescens]